MHRRHCPQSAFTAVSVVQIWDGSVWRPRGVRKYGIGDSFEVATHYECNSARLFDILVAEDPSLEWVAECFLRGRRTLPQLAWGFPGRRAVRVLNFIEQNVLSKDEFASWRAACASGRGEMCRSLADLSASEFRRGVREPQFRVARFAKGQQFVQRYHHKIVLDYEQDVEFGTAGNRQGDRGFFPGKGDNARRTYLRRE